MVRSLDKKWKELLFAFSGFGPNFLMILMGSYYSDALKNSWTNFNMLLCNLFHNLPPI